jgi:hypothetical protein
MTIWRANPLRAARPAAAVTEAPRPGRRPPRRAVLVLAALMVAATVLGACSAVRNDLGTADSDCYVALPAAYSAVHHHGTLHGVRLVATSSLRRRAPLLYTAATRVEPKFTQVCLVAFSGDFSASSLPHAVGKKNGRLAVVELGYPGNRVLATLVVVRLPLAFGHPHI